MNPLEQLLDTGYRIAQQEDLRTLFEIITRKLSPDVFVYGINGGWLREFSFFASGPFSLREGCCVDELCIVGRDAHTLHEMHIRLMTIPEKADKGFAHIRYIQNNHVRESFGDVRIYIPK
jgi:hypothetical protein